MALDALNGNGGRMLVTAVSAELVYQLVGANMSSPQTAELNAAARAPTIGKWVNLTNLEAAGWITLLCALDQSLWPLFGGGLAAVGMWLKYRYAITSGLNKRGKPTENYSSGG